MSSWPRTGNPSIRSSRIRAINQQELNQLDRNAIAAGSTEVFITSGRRILAINPATGNYRDVLPADINNWHPFVRIVNTEVTAGDTVLVDILTPDGDRTLLQFRPGVVAPRVLRQQIAEEETVTLIRLR